MIRVSAVHVAAAIAAAAILPAMSACSSGGSGQGGPVAPASTGASGGAGSTSGTTTAAAQPPQGLWLKGDLHVHTLHSGDAQKWGDTTAISLELADRAGLDFVALTDHRTFAILSDPQLHQHPRVISIPGMEWNGDGHAGAIGYTTPNSFPVTMGGSSGSRNVQLQAVIDEVHNQGGIFIVNHPSSDGDMWVYTGNGYDGIEVWNSYWALRCVNPTDPSLVHQNATQYGLTAPELERACANMNGGLNFQSLKYWEELLNQGTKVAAVGGGDRHGLVMPGGPTTRVFAASASQADILAAIRMGRTMVMRAPDAPEVEFSADRDGDGVFESIVGESIPLGGAVAFRIHVRDADRGKVVLIKNGQTAQSWPIPGPDYEVTFTDTPSVRTWYRVEIFEPLDMSIPQASTLKMLVLGVAGQSWVNNLTSGFLGSVLGWLSGFIGQVQDIIDTGGPAVAWLLINGQQMGVQLSPVLSHYPTLEIPEGVSRILNVDVQDSDYSRGVITSAIWVD